MMATNGAGVEVRLEDLRRSYAGVTALDGLSLTMAPGELVALLGPSGCGKTTAMRLVAGLEEANSGRVMFGGKDVTGLPANKRDDAMDQMCQKCHDIDNDVHWSFKKKWPKIVHPSAKDD